VGVAAAAPATDLVSLLRDDFASAGGKNITAMTLWSWTRVYGASLDRVVEPTAIPIVDALARQCIESIYDFVIRQRIGRPLARVFLSVPNLAEVEPWRSFAAQNSPGPLPPAIPVFLAQGSADMLVRPPLTQAYMSRLCAAGSKVRMLIMPGVGHGFAGRDSANAAAQWMEERFANASAADDCGTR
jgi:acetyl esterase/lipase